MQNQRGGPSLGAFARALADTLAAAGVGRLVVDVRGNGGGNNTLLVPLIRTLIAWEAGAPDRRLFLITDRGTFSAAQNFVNRTAFYTRPVVVGEPSSSRPNFVGEVTETRLPYSGTVVSISILLWQDRQPWDGRPWIHPDLPVPLTAADGRQPRPRPGGDRRAGAVRPVTPRGSRSADPPGWPGAPGAAPPARPRPPARARPAPR